MTNTLIRRIRITLVASLIAMVTSLVSGCSKSPARAIERVLNNCAGQTEEINRSKMSAAQAALELARRMQAMDTRSCPADFRVAFQEHINAWRNAAEYFSADTGLNAFFEGLAAGFFEDASLLGVSARNAQLAAREINVTYQRLVTIAAAYGARVPNSEISG